ncbi:MAG: hypothetical protein EBX52_03040 [Proteobacteria bacterium]|nr:hypothetical protein [Pseudomonadota bacterium]
MKPKLLRSGILLFAVFHLTAIGVCSFPAPSRTRQILSRFFAPYVDFFSLNQNWAMFAPDPYSLNSFIRAEIRFLDGTTRWIAPPRMSTLNLRDRYFLERYRKWADDYIRADGYSEYWPLAARYFARKAYTDAANPPVEVRLWRYWTRIEDPEVRFQPVGYRIDESAMERYQYFKIEINPEIFR